ncbi:hypothetical protein REH81_01575 [Vibrio rotiferianus]
MSTNTPALNLPLELVQEVRNNMEIGQMQPMLIGTKAENVQVPRQATSLGLVVREEDSTIASVAASPDIDLMVGTNTWRKQEVVKPVMVGHYILLQLDKTANMTYEMGFTYVEPSMAQVMDMLSMQAEISVIMIGETSVRVFKTLSPGFHEDLKKQIERVKTETDLNWPVEVFVECTQYMMQQTATSADLWEWFKREEGEITITVG